MHTDARGSLPCRPRQASHGSMKFSPKLLSASLVLICISTLCAQAQTTYELEKRDRGPVTAGVKQFDITPAEQREWRGSPQHVLHVTVWYPAVSGSSEVPQVIGAKDKPLFFAGQAAPNATLIAPSPTLAKMPLIVLSHGSGSAAGQLAWLGAALARAGYVAAAVDHPGNNAKEPYTAQGFILWWERAHDLSDVIDAMLANPEFGTRIDATRIGAAGFSIGGWTVISLAGGRADLSRAEEACHSDPAPATCHTPEMASLGNLEQVVAATRKASPVSLAQGGESFADARIKAVFAISPALAFTFTEDSLRNIHVPVMLVVGSADTVAPAKQNADYLQHYIHGARELEIPNAAHYTFLDVCTERGHHDLKSYCDDPPLVDRDQVHASTGVTAIRFFDRALRVK
jgi:predicted dienelactone hydrolase